VPRADRHGVLFIRTLSRASECRFCCLRRPSVRRRVQTR